MTLQQYLHYAVHNIVRLEVINPLLVLHLLIPMKHLLPTQNTDC